MVTDPNIEEFIGDSFTSIWDLELLAALLDHPSGPLPHAELVERMRASEQVVTQGAQVLTAAGLSSIDGDGGLQFFPVNDNIGALARQAVEFYRRFPGRTRRLLVARQSPGLSAFADAFRLRKD